MVNWSFQYSSRKKISILKVEWSFRTSDLTIVKYSKCIHLQNFLVYEGRKKKKQNWIWNKLEVWNKML